MSKPTIKSLQSRICLLQAALQKYADRDRWSSITKRPYGLREFAMRGDGENGWEIAEDALRADQAPLLVVGSKAPTPNRIGAPVKFKSPYQGYTEGTIVELVGRNGFGVPLYGVHIDGYVDGGGYPITVDFAANEFDDEHGEAYQQDADAGFARIQRLLDGGDCGDD